MRKMKLLSGLVTRSSALILVFGLSSVAVADSGTIDTIKEFTSEYADTRRVDIWLPDGYSASGPALPVIYAQDGQNLFRSETAAWGGNEWGVDETIAKLLAEKKIRSAIVVGIWNTPKRFLEYGPQKPWDALPESTKQVLAVEMKDMFGKENGSEPLSENYLKFMVKELKPYIDKNYNTLPDQSDTFVMGSSMGGLISIYAIARYPDVYGGAMCLSTHWPISIKTDRDDIANAIIGYLDTALPKAGQHRGSRDGQADDGIAALIGEVTHEAHAAAPFVNSIHLGFLQRRNCLADLIQALNMLVQRVLLGCNDAFFS